MEKIVIVGATSAIAEHCARIWVSASPVNLTLIGRDADKLERMVADLRVRGPRSCLRAMTADLLNTEAIDVTVRAVTQAGPINIVLIAHGSLPDQADCQNDLHACRQALDVNAVSPVLYAEAFARHMAVAGAGTLALIGSVAGDRGRKSNYVYGSAKGLVTRYAQGMQHRFAGTGVKVVLIKPGPTDTPMTAALKNKGVELASVEDVAVQIVKAISRGRAVVYVPGKWRLIMTVVRHLPSFVFNQLNV